jgi:acyl-coenzyme A thioesterase PaaI-like protein
MANAYFVPLGGSSQEARWHATEATIGPWDPGQQHGGPPSALLVRTAELVAAEQTGRTDLVALRCAAEFLGPVPAGEVEVTARVVRAARSAVLVALTLSGRDRACLEARVWLLRDADTSGVSQARTETPVPATGPGVGGSFPWAESVEWRGERGSFDEPGPGTAWARPRLPLVEGDTLTALQRAVLVGDAASGLSGELDWAQWSFVNVDLDVHLARPGEGEWIRMDAVTDLGAHGSALARSTLSDVAGPLGTTAQTLRLARLS